MANKLTLERLLETEKARRCEKGAFGIIECKKSIKFKKKTLDVSYYQQLEEYVEKANTDAFFNKTMILACWELINEK